MREILFRGIGTSGNNVQWWRGSLVSDFWGRDKGERGIILADEKGAYVEVHPETVGQYTGLTDKNGEKIFEGDILKNIKTGKIVSVAWNGVEAQFVGQRRKTNNKYLFDDYSLFLSNRYFEIIGNIYDNPELLKEE